MEQEEALQSMINLLEVISSNPNYYSESNKESVHDTVKGLMDQYASGKHKDE